MIRTRASKIGAATLIGAAITALLWPMPRWTSAEPPKGGDPQAQSGDVGGKSEVETRQRLREAIRRRLESSRRESERLEQIAKAIDEGKSFDELRQLMPESGRWARGGPGGGGRNFGELLLRRIEESRGGEGFTDVDTLGPTTLPGMGPGRGSGPDAGPRRSDQIGSAGERVLSEEDRQAVRDVLVAAAPGILQKLDELQKLDPAQAERKFSEAWPRMQFLMEMRLRDRGLYELTLGDVRFGREAMEAARELVAMERRGVAQDSGAYAKQQAALRAALAAQFEQRTRILQHQMDRMRERQAAMARDIGTRPDRQTDVVNRNAAAMIERERRRVERGSSDGAKEPRRSGGT